MKINKVGSSRSEIDLFNILEKRSINKTAMLGGIIRILTSGAKYTAGGFAAGYAIDTVDEYLYGDLSSVDLKHTLFEDQEIFKAYSKLKSISDTDTDIGKICAIWEKIKSGPSRIEDAEEHTTDEEPATDSEPTLDLEEMREALTRYSDKINNILKKADEGCKPGTLLKVISLKDLGLVIANFKSASDTLEASKEKASSYSGYLSSAMNALGSGYEWVKESASLFVDENSLPDSPDNTEDLEAAKKDLELASDEYAKAYEELIKGLAICIKNCKNIIALYKKKESVIKSISSSNIISEIDTRPTERLIEACINFISTVEDKLSSYHKHSAKQKKMSFLVKKHEDNYFIPRSVKFEDKRFSSRYSPIVFKDMHFRNEEQSVFRINKLDIEMPKIYSGSSWINAYTDKVKERISKIITKDLLLVKHLGFFERNATLNKTTKEQDNFFRYLSENGFVNQIVESYRKIIYNITTSNSSSHSKLNQNINSKYDISHGSREGGFMATAHNYKYLMAIIFDIVYVSDDLGSDAMREKIQSAFSLMLEKYISEEWIPYDVKVMKARRKIRKKHKRYDQQQQKTFRKYEDDSSLFANDMEVSAKNQQNNLEKYSDSINKNKSIVKKSNFSDQYYKDAILGPSNPDPLLKEFYQSMRQETLRNSELRDARKNLRSLEEQEGQDIVNQAHPKEIRLSDAHGDGGLLENGNEQKERSLQVAKKNPTGNFR